MAQRLIPVRPSLLSTRKSERRPGMPFSPPAWAESSPKRRQSFIADQRLSATLARTKPWRASRTLKTLSHSPFLPASLLPSEQRRPRDDRERDGGRRPADRRCGAARWPARWRVTFTRRCARCRRAGSRQCPKSRSGRTTLGCCRWAAAPPTRPLADARRSPECAAVEPSRSGALLWWSELTRQRPDKQRRMRSGLVPFSEPIMEVQDGESDIASR
jgi:hypothetical protein